MATVNQKAAKSAKATAGGFSLEAHMSAVSKAGEKAKAKMDAKAPAKTKAKVEAPVAKTKAKAKAAPAAEAVKAKVKTPVAKTKAKVAPVAVVESDKDARTVAARSEKSLRVVARKLAGARVKMVEGQYQSELTADGKGLVLVAKMETVQEYLTENAKLAAKQTRGMQVYTVSSSELDCVVDFSFKVKDGTPVDDELHIVIK